MKNITVPQTRLLRQLQAADPALMVSWDDVRGVAGSVRGKLSFSEKEGKKGIVSPSEETIKVFLTKYAPLFGPSDLAIDALKLLRRKKDDLGWTHLTYQHGLPMPEKSIEEGFIEIYGAKLAAHFNAKGMLVEVQSSLWRDTRVDGEVRVTVKELRDILLKRLESVKTSKELLDRLKKKEENFPLTNVPRLVVYPWKGSFPLAWSAYGYGVLTVDEAGKQTDVPRIAYGHLIIDASTGDQILFSPTFQTSETADTGSGLAVTPLTGTHATRTLNIVRVGTTSTYRLKDTTHNRNIVTFDVACDASFDYDTEIGPAIANGTLPVSEDTDGDRNWNRLPTNTTATQRTSGQPPEVDAHHFVRQQYEWYNALAGGRDGWDDGNYPNPPTPSQTINILAHCRWPGGSCQENNAYKWSRQVGGLWRFWLAFMDGDTTNYDYMAGSRFIVAHEYQHAITDFSFEDGQGNPGLTYSGWLGAVHEGLSDVFGGLSSEQWRPGREISPSNLIFRNLVYTRDTAAYDPNKLDHFDDRNNQTGFYARGTILAHCAYLIGNGGVHRRSGRSPELIPVYGLGRETIGGMSFLKAARIWYRALAHYFSTHGALTGIPTNDENTFRTLRDGCVSAAIDLYGSGSAEHRNTVLAFYAVGLHPANQSYGPDVTFLRWGVSWDLSRSYVGLSCPDYASLDLFVNNGGVSEWNALINIIDPATGQPTQFENTIYCRVRNVGDQSASNVKVEFFYAKAGTAVTTWLPVVDKNGVTQTLNIGALGAGQSTFPDSDQNTPPSSASVKWCIPPLASGEVVHHFCLRAVVTSSNDVNSHNNDAQSNIGYTAYSPATPLSLAFLVGNPFKKEIPLELKLHAPLPKGWMARIVENYKDVRLKPGEERPLTISVTAKRGAEKYLEMPLEGDLQGQMYGHISGPFTGSITETVLEGQSLRGHFSASLPYLGALVGKFEGTIDLSSGQIKGRAMVANLCTKSVESTCVGIDAFLRPWRRVNVSQWLGKELLGGVTVQVQVPWAKGPFTVKLSSTATEVSLGK